MNIKVVRDRVENHSKNIWNNVILPDLPTELSSYRHDRLLDLHFDVEHFIWGTIADSIIWNEIAAIVPLE